MKGGMNRVNSDTNSRFVKFWVLEIKEKYLVDKSHERNPLDSSIRRAKVYTKFGSLML